MPPVWDAENRPATLNGFGLTVDALGRIVEKNNSGSYTQYVFSPTGRKIAVYVGQTLHRTYIPLPAGAEVNYGSSGIAAYAHADWLGSMRLATSPGRAVLADIPYAPYGETYSRTGTYSPEFTGKELDITSPLYDFMFREHNYTEGRWVSPDPAGMAAVDPSNPQTWNRYAYVGDTPLASVDANGTVTLPCGFADVICGDGGGGVGGGWCGDPESDPFGCIPILPPPIPIGGGGGGGSGSGGSGGGGGTGGSGGGTSGGGGSPSPISFPNGENLGLPTGYHFKPLNISQLLGIEPINPGCDFGLCIPAVEGFGPGLILVGAGTAVCEIAEPCGVIEDIIVAVALLEAARELKQAQDTEWSRFPACSAQYGRDRAVCQQRKTRSCWESAAERLATCNASGGTRLGWPPLL